MNTVKDFKYTPHVIKESETLQYMWFQDMMPKKENCCQIIMTVIKIGS